MINSAAEFRALHLNCDKRAANDHASEAVWRETIEKYPELREWVAHNKTVPTSILAILAKDRDPKVRFVVAMKRKCPPEVLGILAVDQDPSIRARVVYNKKTPPGILEKLKRDSSPLVQDALKAIMCPA